MTTASVFFFSPPKSCGEGRSRSGENQQSGDTEAPGTKHPQTNTVIGKITDDHADFFVTTTRLFDKVSNQCGLSPRSDGSQADGEDQ